MADDDQPPVVGTENAHDRREPSICVACGGARHGAVSPCEWCGHQVQNDNEYVRMIMNAPGRTFSDLAVAAMTDAMVKAREDAGCATFREFLERLIAEGGEGSE